MYEITFMYREDSKWIKKSCISSSIEECIENYKLNDYDEYKITHIRKIIV